MANKVFHFHQHDNPFRNDCGGTICKQVIFHFRGLVRTILMLRKLHQLDLEEDGTTAEQLYEVLRHPLYNISSEINYTSAWDCRRWIQEGYMCIVLVKFPPPVNNHWILATRIVNGTIYYNDPYLRYAPSSMTSIEMRSCYLGVFIGILEKKPEPLWTMAKDKLLQRSR